MKRLNWSLTVMFLLAGCNAGPNRTNIELITNMMDQPSIKSQDWDPAQGDKGQMLMPPAHTIARGFPPYAYAEDPAGAEKQPNPFSGNNSPEVLSVGRANYDIYCGLCHGGKGSGDGQIAAAMAVKPRNLISDDAKSYSDGRIFYAITQGRGVMRGYASQIPNPDVRWKIVNYVRSLQK